MKLTFLGAAGTVTGSKYLLEHKNKKILIDCGLFQGLKELRLLNWQTPSFDPASIDFILLTHGHLDHVGFLPRLVKLGFKGKIYATAPTLKVAEITLNDTAKIQEEEAERANREGYSKHAPAMALYDLKDVERTQKLFIPMQEGEWYTIDDLFKVSFQYNGHILGSTFIQIEVGGKTFVFSGDVGREKDFMLYPPKKPTYADVLLIESTYGGKVTQSEEATLPEMQKIINETIERNGSLFIPSFAVERTQLVMLILWRLLKAKEIPKVPIIMDSPMGADVFRLFHEFQAWHKIKPEEFNAIKNHIKIVSRYEETLNLREDKSPKIVIAGSGMMTGGRILSYLEVQAQDEKNTLLFVGFQAEGTRGRKLLDGDRFMKAFGKTIPVRMQIKNIEGLSAHGDQNELLNWLSDLRSKPSYFFITHGEKEQALLFKEKLKEEKGIDAQIAQLNQQVEIS